MCYFNVFFLFVMLCTSALSFWGWLSYFLEMLFGLYKKSPADSSGESRGLTHIIYSLLSFCQVSGLTCCLFLLGNRGFVLESVVDISEDALLGASYG